MMLTLLTNYHMLPLVNVKDSHFNFWCFKMCILEIPRGSYLHTWTRAQIAGPICRYWEDNCQHNIGRCNTIYYETPPLVNASNICQNILTFPHTFVKWLQYLKHIGNRNQIYFQRLKICVDKLMAYKKIGITTLYTIYSYCLLISQIISLLI